MTSRVVRTAVSLEPELLRALDRWAGLRSAKSRSDAIRYLIRREAAEELLGDPDTDAVGTVMVLYDHRAREIQRRLTATQHRWGEHIRSSNHVHLAGDLCLEVMVLLGRRDELVRAAEELRGVKGVQQGGFLLATPRTAGGHTGHVHPHPHPAVPGRPPRKGPGRRAGRSGRSVRRR